LNTNVNNFIDDTEDTGAQIGNAAPVAGKVITVDLAGSTPVMVSSVNVSAAAGLRLITAVQRPPQVRDPNLQLDNRGL